jgi:hypothetical protein
MSGGADDGATRVWRADELERALGAGTEGPRRRARGRGHGHGAGGRAPSAGWQVLWRLVLWAVALGLGWYVGTRYFG